jgi:hypothetical protein
MKEYLAITKNLYILYIKTTLLLFTGCKQWNGMDYIDFYLYVSNAKYKFLDKRIALNYVLLKNSWNISFI